MNGLACACTAKITSEPEVKFTATGKQMLQFSALLDEHQVVTEQRPERQPTWLRLTVWEDQAAALADALHKGDLIYCEGKLQHNTWESRDGEMKCGLAISAWRVDQHGKLGKQAPPRREPTPALTGAPGHAPGPWSDWARGD